MLTLSLIWDALFGSKLVSAQLLLTGLVIDCATIVLFKGIVWLKGVFK